MANTYLMRVQTRNHKFQTGRTPKTEMDSKQGSCETPACDDPDCCCVCWVGRTSNDFPKKDEKGSLKIRRKDKTMTW